MREWDGKGAGMADGRRSEGGSEPFAVGCLIWCCVQVVPSAASLLIKALNEPERDRKKEKNSTWKQPRASSV